MKQKTIILKWTDIALSEYNIDRIALDNGLSAGLPYHIRLFKNSQHITFYY